MKKSLLMMMFVALGFLLAGASTGHAQGSSKGDGYFDFTQDEEPEKWEDAKAAAEFAVDEQAKKQDVIIKFVSLDRVEMQGVAPYNYRLCLKVEVEDKENNKDVKIVKVVIERNINQQGQYKLKSWEEVEECGKG